MYSAEGSYLEKTSFQEREPRFVRGMWHPLKCRVNLSLRLLLNVRKSSHGKYESQQSHSSGIGSAFHQKATNVVELHFAVLILALFILLRHETGHKTLRGLAPTHSLLCIFP